MKDISQLIESLKDYSSSKEYILENINDLTEEELQEIIENVALEQDLTENEVEDMLNELFGIGATVKGVAKRIGTKVATPFKKAAGFVKGVGQGIANVSRNLDAKAAAYQKTKLDDAKQKQTSAVKQSVSSGKKIVPGGTARKFKPKPATPATNKPASTTATTKRTSKPAAPTPQV